MRDTKHSESAFLLSSNEPIDSRVVAQRLRLDEQQLADALGVPVNALQHVNTEQAPRVQTRLRELIDILNQTQPWAGSAVQAFAWFRSQPLPAFGGQTAEELVKEGKAAGVIAHLARIREGGYA